MKKVKVFDTTLRDGEQTPRVSLKEKSKIEIAKGLVELGVDIIEVGFPAASEADFSICQEISKTLSNHEICTFARSKISDIDMAGRAIKYSKKPSINIVTSISDLHIFEKLGLDREGTLELMESSIKRALEYTDNVYWIAEDSSRAGKDFLNASFQHAINLGAKTVTYADTCGFALPQQIASDISLLKQSLSSKDDYNLGIHCHNDLGMSVANTITALCSGANEFQGTINGIGERAGNAPIEEIVMALRLHRDTLGIDTNIDTTCFRHLSELVSSFTNIPLPVNKPIVGANAFTHSSGMHQDGVIKNAKAYEILDPQEIGLKGNNILIDRLSGRKGIAFKANQMGFNLSADETDVLFGMVKAYLANHAHLDDNDFIKMISESTTKS
ncbi:MAG: 2-isopropylmalate synthase [Bdellovibrionota bacterium]|nr:2-isopropylmalate synthase [Bdellovibrionota bacterium]